MRLAGPVFAAAAGALVAACGTVDPGPPPAEVNACRPSRAFFVEQIWPNVLAKDYGAKRCAAAGCHDANSMRQLVLLTPLEPWPPPLPLPADWERMYKLTAEQLVCSNVDASPLLRRLDGREVHGGGMMIARDGAEAMLIQQWVSAP